MLSSQSDTFRIGNPAVPFDKSLRDLDGRPHLVDGSNMLGLIGGKLIKRPGVATIANTTLNSARAARLVSYRTAEDSPKIYIVGSFLVGSVYKVYYIRLDSGTPAWTAITDLRDVQSSTRPHRLLVARGLCFIKGFPGPSADKYGTVIFDGTDTTTRFWGLPAPTTPARIGGSFTTLASGITAAATSLTVAADLGVTVPFTVSIGEEDLSVTAKGGGGNVNWTVTRAANSTTASAHSQGAEVLYKDWTASSHAVTVNLGWRYVYCYKTNTGHVTCRSRLESNPDKRPSDTSGFADKRPKVDVQGHSDTTRVPKIVIFRTTDAGSGFFRLEEITNTGSGTITYVDDQLAGENGALDPLPDKELDTAFIAPSLVDNLPPPTVNPPLVQGTDQPAWSSPIEYFAGRLWYGIGHILYYSGNEEIVEGVPEESWPSKNVFRLRSRIVGMKATREALYVFTDSDMYLVRGTDKETLSIDLAAAGFGLHNDHAITEIGDEIAWLTQNIEIAITQLDQPPRIISVPLKNELITGVSGATDIELRWFSKRDKDYIILNIPSLGKQWVYDRDLEQWNTPWTIVTSAMVVSPINSSETAHYLVMWIQNGVNGSLGAWSDLETTVQDLGTNYSCFATFGLSENAAGYHLNERAIPNHTTVSHAILIERTKFASDTDPTVVYYKDDLWTTPVSPGTAENPARREASVGYDTKFYPVNAALQRIAVKISKDAANERFELQTVAYVNQPGSGA